MSRTASPKTADTPNHGLRANRGQFALLLAALVFAVMMTGPERSVLPVIGREEFGIGTTTATLSFIVAFGVAKALANLFAAGLADRIGRNRVLLAGWVVAQPVAPMIIFAPSWGWVVGANVLLGTASGLIWSSSVVMRLDLAGPKHRGLAMGLSGVGPIGLGVTALVAGWLAQSYGPRPIPFLIVGVAAVVGFLLALRVRDTGQTAQAEQDGVDRAADAAVAHDGRAPEGTGARIVWASWRKRDLFAANQAGLTLNMSDGVVWGILPLFLTQEGLGLREVGLIAGSYPIVVGLVETVVGPLSDRWGRRPLIAGGMLLLAAGFVGFAMVSTLPAWLAMAGAMGVGYAAAFPSLTAQVSDSVEPRSRPAAIGVYRMWRDVGHAVGGVTAGLLGDLLGLRWAIGCMAALLALSGCYAAYRLREGARGAEDTPLSS